MSLALFARAEDDSDASADIDPGIWQDSELTTEVRTWFAIWSDSWCAQVWRLVHSHDNIALKELIESNPKAIHARSSDGRGALFWAYEYGNDVAVQLLEQSGAPLDVKDSKGLGPRDMAGLTGDADDQYDDEE